MKTAGAEDKSAPAVTYSRHSPIFFSWLTEQNRRTDAARCTIQPISTDCFPVILQHGAFLTKQTV